MNLMDDLIRRGDAVLAVQRYGVGAFYPGSFHGEPAERFVIERLKEVPAANVIDGKECTYAVEKLVIFCAEHKCASCPLHYFFPKCGEGWHIAQRGTNEEMAAAIKIVEAVELLKRLEEKA